MNKCACVYVHSVHAHVCVMCACVINVYMSSVCSVHMHMWLHSVSACILCVVRIIVCTHMCMYSVHVCVCVCVCVCVYVSVCNMCVISLYIHSCGNPRRIVHEVTPINDSTEGGKSPHAHHYNTILCT